MKSINYKNIEEINITDFIDLHVHIGPEILPRKYTVPKIIAEEEGNIKALVLKSHLYPTMPLIKSFKNKSKLILIGSVTLNNYVGGLNPDAIYASAKISDYPIVVWFPTINSENFLKRSKYEIPPEWVSDGFVSRLSKNVKGISVLDSLGNLTKDAIATLKAIKENNCILATGHISSNEAEVLVRTAVKMGIDKVVITHPIYQLIDMPIKTQIELTQLPGVFIEANYAMWSIDKVPIERIAQQIKKIGATKCIISSDMGQVNSPAPSEGLALFIMGLLSQGISEEQIKLMGITNPKKLIFDWAAP